MSDSASGMTSSQPSRPFMPIAKSSLPSTPSSLSSVLCGIISGRSGYTANACATAPIEITCVLRSLPLGPAKNVTPGRRFSNVLGVGDELRLKSADTRFLRGAEGEDGRAASDAE